MSPNPVHATRGRHGALTLAALSAAAIAGAVLPALAGLAFLISLARRKPLIATAVHRWPWRSSWPTGHQPERDRRVMNGLTGAWGIARRCCIWTVHGMLKPRPPVRDQIAKARSSKATATRRVAGSSTASS
jgi:hypothetical protein